MRVAARALIPFAFAYVGGWGGLFAGIMWWQIVDLLNTRRPPEDQIPVALVTWKDFIKYEHVPVWKYVRAFHRQFPESRLYFWYWASLAWMFAFFLAGVVILFRQG